MEEEIHNFIMVWYSILMSSFYCYGITKLFPKGILRLFTFLPVLCLFVLLPFYLNSVNFIIPSAFSVTWLTSFKILLLAWGTGPLSNPSLSLYHFALIFCLPIKLLQAKSPKHPPSKGKDPPKRFQRNLDKSQVNQKSQGIEFRPTLNKAISVSVMVFLINVGFHKDKLPQNIVSFLTCVFVCVGLQIVLEAAAITGRLLLGMHVELPFDKPHLSNSFQDFWGNRWNRVAAGALRSTVFDPTLYHGSRVLGPKWATILALLATFVVSALMHEIIFYHLVRTRMGWGTQLFFLFQGLCVVMERTLRRKLDLRWNLSPIITGPLILLLVLGSFICLALPELMQHKVVDRALEEYAAVGALVKDLGLLWAKTGFNFLKLFSPTASEHGDFSQY